MTDGPIKATGAETAGAYAAVEFAAPPGDVPPPRHVHHRTTEAFYVIDGALCIVLDDREVTADAGSFVTVPPGVVHTFAVRGDAPARFLVIVSPPEFVGYFQEMLGLTSTAGSGPHDIELVDEG